MGCYLFFVLASAFMPLWSTHLTEASCASMLDRTSRCLGAQVIIKTLCVSERQNLRVPHSGVRRTILGPGRPLDHSETGISQLFEQSTDPFNFCQGFGHDLCFGANVLGHFHFRLCDYGSTGRRETEHCCTASAKLHQKCPLTVILSSVSPGGVLNRSPPHQMECVEAQVLGTVRPSPALRPCWHRTSPAQYCD